MATMGISMIPVGCAATDEVVEVPPQPPAVSSEKELSATITIVLQKVAAVVVGTMSAECLAELKKLSGWELWSPSVLYAKRLL